jgi:hypothetical protein
MASTLPGAPEPCPHAAALAAQVTDLQLTVARLSAIVASGYRAEGLPVPEVLAAAAGDERFPPPVRRRCRLTLVPR